MAYSTPDTSKPITQMSDAEYAAAMANMKAFMKENPAGYQEWLKNQGNSTWWEGGHTAHDAPSSAQVDPFTRIGKFFGLTNPTPTSTAGMEEDRAKARAMADALGKESTGPGAQVETPPDLQFRNPGEVEREAAIRAAIPQTIDVGGGLRADQGSYLDTLKAAAAGNAPSVAETSYLAKLGDVERSALGLAGTARGSDRGSARLAAMREVADQTRRAARDAAMIRAGETTTARGALGGALSDIRGQDVSIETGNVERGMTVEEANAARAQAALSRATEAANRRQEFISSGQTAADEASLARKERIALENATREERRKAELARLQLEAQRLAAGGTTDIAKTQAINAAGEQQAGTARLGAVTGGASLVWPPAKKKTGNG